jgi:hypothetical protein
MCSGLTMKKWSLSLAKKKLEFLPKCKNLAQKKEGFVRK